MEEEISFSLTVFSDHASAKLLQSRDPIDHSLPASSIHGILLA